MPAMLSLRCISQGRLTVRECLLCSVEEDLYKICSINFTITGPCIVLCLFNKDQQDALFFLIYLTF